MVHLGLDFEHIHIYTYTHLRAMPFSLFLMVLRLVWTLRPPQVLLP